MKYAKSFRYQTYVVGSVLVGFLASCGASKSGETAGVNQIDSLKVVFSQLSVELDTAWTVMEKDDNDKLFELKRLLDEVSYTNVYDKTELEQLREKVDQLKEMRYDRKTMAESSKIDMYDSATQAIMSEVILYAQNNPQFKNYPLMKELINDIMESDHQVLFFRTRYDDIARQYNDFILSHKDLISDFSKGKELDNQPLFTLSE